MIDLASIPRTRARVTGYSFGSRRPIYDRPLPYAKKLPADLLAKDLVDMTLEDALAFALAADRPDPGLDQIIWYKAVFDPALRRGDGLELVGAGKPAYSQYLDHAILLYEARPPMIETDPLDVICDALRLRLLTSG